MSAKKVVCCCDFKDLLFCKLVKVSVCKLCIFLVFGFLRGEQLAITSIPPGGRRGRNPPRCSSQPRRSRQPGWSRWSRWSRSYSYLIFVIFFTQAKFLENKIYTEKKHKLRQNTQKIANILRYYGKIHSKLAIFHVKSVKIYTGQKKFTRIYSWRS